MQKALTRFKRTSNQKQFRIWLKWAGLYMKRHQVQANDWCESCEAGSFARGGILADEMGLGKTVVMLGRIFTHYTDNALIVVPATLLHQWGDFISRWLLKAEVTPFLKGDFHMFHGQGTHISLESLCRKKIVLTSYGTLRRRAGTLEENEWDRIIFDEAHHLKDHHTLAFQMAKRVCGSARICWLMTGTPIQNRTQDLFSLCELLGYSKGDIPDNIHNIIKTKLLMRTAAEVGVRLPAIKSIVSRVAWLGDGEEALSARIHSWLNFRLSDDDEGVLAEPSSIPKLALLTRARQMCILPSTIEEAIRKQNTHNFVPGAAWAAMTASKMEAVFKKLKKRAKNGTRKLVFCHYRREIDELVARLTKAGITVASLDGRTTGAARVALLGNDKTPQILVLQIQTACEGLNLQSFNEVYFTSPHWNPAVEAQAIARCHRIGQKKTVRIFRFAMKNHECGLSIDNYCTHVQRGKKQLIRDFFEEGEAAVPS